MPSEMTRLREREIVREYDGNGFQFGMEARIICWLYRETRGQPGGKEPGNEDEDKEDDEWNLWQGTSLKPNDRARWQSRLSEWKATLTRSSTSLSLVRDEAHLTADVGDIRTAVQQPPPQSYQPMPMYNLYMYPTTPPPAIIKLSQFEDVFADTGFAKVPDDELPRFYLKPGWENMLPRKCRPYVVNARDQRVIDTTIAKLMSQERIFRTRRPVPFSMPVFVVYRSDPTKLMDTKNMTEEEILKLGCMVVDTRTFNHLNLSDAYPMKSQDLKGMCGTMQRCVEGHPPNRSLVSEAFLIQHPLLLLPGDFVQAGGMICQRLG
ncbi:hypothetical protein F5Y05DRAFT_407723 [Hypoxylon sp. FL0543]|nr:hypothetical protein F5Y05DRAFT_407723 [Hypoxylon sp. FL0543]